MYRICTQLTVLVLCAAVAGAAAAQTGGLRYSVKVSTFENKSNWQGRHDLGHAWSTILTERLNNSNRFIVIAENDMRKEAANEQALSAAGVTVQGKRAPAHGQMTPAQILVKGVITHFQSEVSGKDSKWNVGGIGFGKKKETAEINATIYMADASTGMVIASKSVVGESTKKKRSVKVDLGDVKGSEQAFNNDNDQAAVVAAIDKAIAWMASQIGHVQWRGSIVLVKGDLIYINRGRREGVTEGQTFSVGESEIIRDPDTGEVIDEFVTERARMQAVRINEKTTACKLVTGKLNSVFKGMGVMPVAASDMTAP